MKDILVRLKGLLNSYTDEELKDITLWVDCEDEIQAFMVEDGNITLITDLDQVSIRERKW